MNSRWVLFRIVLGLAAVVNGLYIHTATTEVALASVEMCGGMEKPTSTPTGDWACCVDFEWYDTGTHDCCDDPNCSSCGTVYELSGTACCCEGSLYNETP